MSKLSIQREDNKISLISSSGKKFGGSTIRGRICSRIESNDSKTPAFTWYDFSQNIKYTTIGNGTLLESKSSESNPQSNLKITIKWQTGDEGRYIDEYVTITNEGLQKIEINDLDIGLSMKIKSDIIPESESRLDIHKDWNIFAIPFRVQPDGKEYYFGFPELLSRKLVNPSYHTDCKHWPDVCDPDKIRSEAWYMGNMDDGLLVIKYNPSDIEYTLISIDKEEEILNFGGVGFSLYHEPSCATKLEAGETFSFGVTRYIAVSKQLITANNSVQNQNSVSNTTIIYNAEQIAMQTYSDFLKSHNHTYPKDYNPPVHWNELYDIGWYHSIRKLLKKNYTKEALLREADKAVACHAEALYLDPGWEVCEGTTLFDEERLGPAVQLVEDLKEKGLSLMFRTILRDYKGWVPKKWRVKHDKSDRKISMLNMKLHLLFKEPCLINLEFYQEKFNRIATVANAGTRFIMFDEMDWRGPCHNGDHRHGTPSTAFEHANKVYDLCRDVRTDVHNKRGFDLLIEAHDPVWPWQNRYCPTYYRQGFDSAAAYQENWGFEFMWNCITDLHAGKALTLYYYACSCSIPLYLHITMSHDNENCLFFWWAASTVRHLGIGGKTCNRTLCPTHMKHSFDQEEHFKRYCQYMDEYQKHKEWFVRGNFIGIDEDHHLHTLDNLPGGALVAFNLDLTPQKQTIKVYFEQINWTAEYNPPVVVSGDISHNLQFENRSIIINIKIPADNSVRIYLGDAIKS
jgi:hypothetical protein